MNPVLSKRGESSPADRASTTLAWAWIALVAFTLRWLHWLEIRANDPFFGIPAVDGRLYHAWAQEIASGDLVGEGVLILGPLYPYAMGLLYWLVGPSLAALKAIQVVLGTATCLLVWQLARELFDRRVGWLAGMGAALYGMLVFYGGAVMIVNLQVPLVLGVAILSIRALRAPTWPRWLCLGLLVGVSVLARQTMLIYALLLVAWHLRPRRSHEEGEGILAPTRMRWASVAAFVLGIALLVAPFTIRNYVVGGDLVLLNSVGGTNFYMGNNARSNGAWSPPRLGAHRVDSPLAMREAFAEVAESEAGRSLAPSEVSRHWQAKALAHIRSNPGAWLALELKKLSLFFNATEVWNNRSIEISRDFSWVLRLPLLGYAVVAPLGLLGLALSWRRWRDFFPLYALLGAYLVTGLAFFILSRYRLPAAMVLLVFAAHALVALWDMLRARSWKKLGVSVAALLPLVWWTQYPFVTPSLQMAWFNLGNKYRDLGRLDHAIDSYRKSLAYSGSFISGHNNLAMIYERTGRTEESVAHWERVLALAEYSGDVRKMERAERHLRNLQGAHEDSPR